MWLCLCCGVFRSGVWLQFVQSVSEGEQHGARVCHDVHQPRGEQRWVCGSTLKQFWALSVPGVWTSPGHFSMSVCNVWSDWPVVTWWFTAGVVGLMFLDSQTLKWLKTQTRKMIYISIPIMPCRSTCRWFVQSQWKPGHHSETTIRCQSWWVTLQYDWLESCCCDGRAVNHTSECVCVCMCPDEKVNLVEGKWEDVHVTTGALKMFFRELPEPLFTFKFFHDFINAISTSLFFQTQKKKEEHQTLKKIQIFQCLWAKKLILKWRPLCFLWLVLCRNVGVQTESPVHQRPGQAAAQSQPRHHAGSLQTPEEVRSTLYFVNPRNWYSQTEHRESNYKSIQFCLPC